MNAREAAANRARGGQVERRPGNGTEQQQQGDPSNTMRTLLERMKPELALALPKHMTPDRMARQALTAFRTTKKLDECTPQSFLGALMTCAQVGLEPGPQGHVYIVPYWNSRARAFEATFILGYRGIIELARRSSELIDISAHTVYAREVDEGRFTVTYGTRSSIEHQPIVFGERGDPVGYYATATLRSGGRPFVVLSRDDVEKFRIRSATQKDTPSGPWNTDYEAMAWKTCVRRLERWLPQSAELAAAVGHEETVRDVMPGKHVATVLDMQPPTPADDEVGDDAHPHPSELEGQQRDPQQPPMRGEDEQPRPDNPVDDGSDPWGDPGTPPDPSDGDDPWANQ